MQRDKIDSGQKREPTNDEAAYHIYDEPKGKKKGNSNTQAIWSNDKCIISNRIGYSLFTCISPICIIDIFSRCIIQARRILVYVNVL